MMRYHTKTTAEGGERLTTLHEPGTEKLIGVIWRLMRGRHSKWRAKAADGTPHPSRFNRRLDACEWLMEHHGQTSEDSRQ